MWSACILCSSILHESESFSSARLKRNDGHEISSPHFLSHEMVKRQMIRACIIITPCLVFLMLSISFHCICVTLTDNTQIHTDVEKLVVMLGMYVCVRIGGGDGEKREGEKDPNCFSKFTYIYCSLYSF